MFHLRREMMIYHRAPAHARTAPHWIRLKFVSDLFLSRFSVKMLA